MTAAGLVTEPCLPVFGVRRCGARQPASGARTHECRRHEHDDDSGRHECPCGHQWRDEG